MTAKSIRNGVIVAEDDALMRGIIRSLLTNAQQQVFLARDGLEAVTLAREFKARLVLLDIDLPRLNGLLACKAIRELPDYAEVPIVMLTGYTDNRIRQAAIRLKSNELITKPFRPTELLEQLRKYLDLPASAGPAPAGFDQTETVNEREWASRPSEAKTKFENGQLNNGREMMRIYRGAESKT